MVNQSFPHNGDVNHQFAFLMVQVPERQVIQIHCIVFYSVAVCLEI